MTHFADDAKEPQHRMGTSLILEAKMIRISLHGEVTREDLQDLIGRLSELESRQERVPDRLVMICDDVMTLLRYEAIEEFAAQRSSLCYRNSIRTALVATRPLQHGYARMIQSLNTNPQVEIQIFPTQEQAQHWIASPRPSLPLAARTVKASISA